MQSREALHIFDVCKLNLAKPNLPEDVYLENIKNLQKLLNEHSGVLDFSSPSGLSNVYRYLYEGATKYPNLKEDILNTYDACVKLPKGNANGAFMEACNNLIQMYQVCSREEIKKCMQIEKNIMDNPTNDGYYMGEICSQTILPLQYMKDIDMRQYTTSVMKKAASKEFVNADIVLCLEQLVKDDNMDSKDALDIIQKCSDIENKENGFGIEMVSYSVLQIVAKKNPELAPEILKTYSSVINNCKPYLFRTKPEKDAFKAAENLEKMLPEYSGKFKSVYQNRRSIQEINDEHIAKLNEKQKETTAKSADEPAKETGLLSRLISRLKKRD